jgi:hypothetical protein
VLTKWVALARQGIRESATSITGPLGGNHVLRKFSLCSLLASIAQLVERDFSKVKVQSSTLCGSTDFLTDHFWQERFESSTKSVIVQVEIHAVAVRHLAVKHFQQDRCRQTYASHMCPRHVHPAWANMCSQTWASHMWQSDMCRIPVTCCHFSKRTVFL